jgi:fructosamine-3-kinase
MLRHLAAHDLPVPELIHAEPTLLVITHVEAEGPLNGNAEEHAADLIAALHGHGRDAFGFDTDTLIGGLHQPNPASQSWSAFFRDHRLLYMAGIAHDAGRLPASVLRRIETLAARLDTWIDDDAAPALIHGDLWGGNVLAGNGRIAAFIDPAIYYADPEIELAFTTLFGTFGERFFARYAEHRALRPGFFDVRKDLYNLYPLLVHVRLFGGSYVADVTRTLDKLGC